MYSTFKTANISREIDDIIGSSRGRVKLSVCSCIRGFNGINQRVDDLIAPTVIANFERFDGEINRVEVDMAKGFGDLMKQARSFSTDEDAGRVAKRTIEHLGAAWFAWS